jgi:uncharacterized protein
MLHSSTSKLATITALHIYPIKSCGGISLQRARLTATGFEHDRQWLIVNPNGRFITQREVPHLALIRPALSEGMLHLSAPDVQTLSIAVNHEGAAIEVVCWRDRCKAIDAGDQVAQWLQRFLGQQYRLVRFDPTLPRVSDRAWTGNIDAFNQFSDAFPWLLISQASLDDLNGRLEQPLPMNRFRPNLVVVGLSAFEEDSIHDFSSNEVTLLPVKGCTRCTITTTNQDLGEPEGEEPLRTLRSFRFDRELKGVTFGQNLVLSNGIGEWLEVGQSLAVRHRDPGRTTDRI